MRRFAKLVRFSDAMNPHARMLEPDRIGALVAYLAKD